MTIENSFDIIEGYLAQIDPANISEADIQATLEQVYLEEYAEGLGIPVESLTSEDIALISGLLLIAYTFLSGFIEKVENGQYSEAQIVQLLTGYITSSRQAYELANLRRVQINSPCGVQNITLPAMPGDGSTQCLSWCKCHWEHIFDSRGCWVGARWVLGQADHCPNCSARASQWNPLIMIEYTQINGQWVARRVG